MGNEIISIFYGTTFEQLGVIIYPIPIVILIWSNTLFSSCLYNQALDMFIRYTPVMSFLTRTDGVEYEFKTDDSSE